MPTERKSTMISARLPSELVARVDFVTRNNGDVRNRSTALRAALEDWLPGLEHDIRKQLGTPPKKSP
jgi:Arc/MetJ-type ribon-helix-helix transcriptional regulator